VLFVSAPLWTALLLPGFAPECLSLSVELTRIQLIGMFFSAQSCVLRAACHARQKYFWAEFSQLVEALLGMSALLWLVPIWGVYGAAWTYVLRAILLALLLLPGIGRRSGHDRGGVLIRTAWCRVKPLAIASLYYKSGPLLDRFLTSLAPPGGLSFFYFSQQFFEVANHLINRAAAPALPLLTVQIKTGKPQLFKNTYRGQLLIVFVLAVLSMVVFVQLAEPLLRLARKIDDDDVRLFWWITVAFAGFFIGGAMGQVLSSAFYARGDVQTPTKVGVVGFSVGTGLKLLGFQLAGLPGIALATSFYYLGNAAALYLLLEKKESVLSGYGGA
jgi:putative peptidoglycan lipid II flippase